MNKQAKETISLPLCSIKDIADIRKLNRQSKENKEIVEVLYKCYSSLHPVAFMAYKNGDVQKAPTQKKINSIENIKKMGLPNGVINVLIDLIFYIFKTNYSTSYAETIAVMWKEKEIIQVEDAMKEAAEIIIEREKKREFNRYAKFYMNTLQEKFNMPLPIAKEIVRYSKKTNNGVIVYWFLDRVAEYVNKHDPSDAKATKELLNNFHEKYVVPFGR
jgi:replication initiation and membrane attachment protein DnaB